jgi:hypothetical protein
MSFRTRPTTRSRASDIYSDLSCEDSINLSLYTTHTYTLHIFFLRVWDTF